MSNYLSPGVYVDEVDTGSRPIEGAGTAVAAFVGFAAKGPINEPRLVTNWSQYLDTFGEPVAGTYLGLSLFHYFDNGGGSAYVIRVGGQSDGGGSHAAVELPSAAKADQVSYRVKALESGADGDTISVQVIHDPPAPAPAEGSGGEAAPAPLGEPTFTLVVRGPNGRTERHANLVTKKGKGVNNVATVVNEVSGLIGIEELVGSTVSERLPMAGEFRLQGGASAAPVKVSTNDYVGDTSARSGLGGLEAIEGVTMVAVPDLMAAYESGKIDRDGVRTVQGAIIAHCERMGDRMAILDPLPGLSPQQVHDWRVTEAGYDSKFAALYWPWVSVFDPARGRNVFAPPSGMMAGIWSRNDETRGVHKAPANEVVHGAIDLEANVTRAEHNLLNPNGINVIRAFPGRGIRVWGARTLSSDPDWRYINVRRLFNYIETSILNETNWVVFEPNDLELWQRIRRTINGFLTRIWREGALFGATPQEAFFTKCDEETNPESVRRAGQVVCQIGVAPVTPAEFVVFRISQFSGGGGEIDE